jgi:hypothetical protein
MKKTKTNKETIDNARLEYYMKRKNIYYFRTKINDQTIKLTFNISEFNKIPIIKYHNIYNLRINLIQTDFFIKSVKYPIMSTTVREIEIKGISD